MPGLKAIAQDRRLDILALGTTDTTLNGKDYTLSTVYRLQLKSPNGYGLKNAWIRNKVVHPFYFKTNFEDVDAQVNLEAIAIQGDNSYYITRSGPRASTTQFGGPDDAVLQFTTEDKYLSPVLVQTQLGLLSDYFRDPKGIAGLAQPPQSTIVNMGGDFLYSSLDPGTPIKVQYIRKQNSDNGASFNFTELPAGDTTKADRFLYDPYRFQRPVDLAITGDGTNYLFVLDETLDSLFVFNASGYEGVRPPAGSASTKVVNVSFGGGGLGLKQFNRPSAVFYYNKIVYVADAGNGRILRFKLTTDIQ